MKKISFSFLGKSISASISTLSDIQPASMAAAAIGKLTGKKKSTNKKAATKKASQSDVDSTRTSVQRATAAIQAVQVNESRNDLNRLGSFNESSIPFMISDERKTVTIPTASIIVMAAKAAERKAIVLNLRKRFGLTVIEEGLCGKILMRAAEDGLAGIQTIQTVLNSYPRGYDAISPNFLRVREHRRIDASVVRKQSGTFAAALPWNLQNLGAVGVAGADVKAVAAWAITKGDPSIRVAVLDEGVDVNHPSLKDAIVDSKDFSGSRSDSTPDGNDAHGTACAGIIASRDATFPGVAPNVSLIGARIARSNPTNPDQWIFDDFRTADAIDWCWDDAKADVLSNSWGGGPPSDAIRLAFLRARTQGRSGKGCLIAIAAGNSQSAIPFPATLPNLLVVGASNQWDKRKTKTSQDGEHWWGSCFGPTMGLVAPGVKIAATDISGAAGYSNADFIDTFNGTSSATPHVAAAAALILSVNGRLTEKQVRNILTSTCDPIPGTASEVGKGRLNVEAAVKKAQRSSSKPPKGTVKKKTPKPTSKASKKVSIKKKIPAR